jgi:hypothetical protein
MLEPQKVISESTSNGVSVCFCAQWYPNVVAQLIPAIASGKTLTTTLMGSLINDKDKAVECAHADLTHSDDGIPTKIAKPAGEYWLYFWLKVETEDADATIEEAYIGAGGA